MPRFIAPLSVLLLSCALPYTASAATSTRSLCQNAQNNPGSFLRQPDFAESILRMSTSCPDLAIALTNTITGTIIEASGTGADPKIKAQPGYADLVDRLKVATRNLDIATTNVTKAQNALDRAIRRAKQVGLSEEDLQAVYAMDGAGGKPTLPDYTAGKRKALDNYVAARERLAVAEAKLDQANERAEPLVGKALELAGKANVAQGDLAEVLGGLTAAERQALLDKTLAEATQSITDLEARIAASEAAFDQASKALKAALNHAPYTDALAKFEKQQAVYGRAASDLEEADARFAAAEAKLRERLAEDDRCNGNACRTAKRQALRAAGELAVAKVVAGREARDLERAQKDLEQYEKSLDLEGLSIAYNAEAATLAANKAAEVLARDAAENTARQARELADLLSAASEALTKADAAAQEAKAATAAEEAEVAAARAALEQAIAEANAALDGSAAELAALEDVHAAKVDLQKALDTLGAAQVTADALIQEAAAVENAPTEVVEATEALETSDAEADAAAAAAEEARQAAANAIIDYHETEGELRDALEAEDETTAEAPASNETEVTEKADQGSEENQTDTAEATTATDTGTSDTAASDTATSNEASSDATSSDTGTSDTDGSDTASSETDNAGDTSGANSAAEGGETGSAQAGGEATGSNT